MPRWNDNIESFERGEHKSGGDLTCDSICSDGHTIRKGAVVFWTLSNVEYDEWRPVCRRHATEGAKYQY